MTELRDSLAQVQMRKNRRCLKLPKLSHNDALLIRQALNGEAKPKAIDYLIERGHVVRMGDGRNVVTIPARDAYFAHRRLYGPRRGTSNDAARAGERG
jgi:hypothetical protein